MFLHLLQFANSAPAQAKRMRDMAKAAAKAGQPAAASAAAATPRVRRRWRCGVSGCQSLVINVPEHLDRHFASRSCPEVLRRLHCYSPPAFLSFLSTLRASVHSSLACAHDMI